MKAFEFIHAILMLALVIGVPVAAATRGSHEEFSISRALGQAGVAAGVIVVLLVLNLLLKELFSRFAGDKKR